MNVNISFVVCFGSFLCHGFRKFSVSALITFTQLWWADDSTAVSHMLLKNDEVWRKKRALVPYQYSEVSDSVSGEKRQIGTSLVLTPVDSTPRRVLLLHATMYCTSCRLHDDDNTSYTQTEC